MDYHWYFVVNASEDLIFCEAFMKRFEIQNILKEVRFKTNKFEIFIILFVYIVYFISIFIEISTLLIVTNLLG